MIERNRPFWACFFLAFFTRKPRKCVEMNIQKQESKLRKLWIKAAEALTRKESKSILKKVKKIARKLSEESEK